jgi:uncharacterized protein YgbK (DUF1537 family)
MRLTPVAIIADDLTGAADTAAVFARPARPVPVSLRAEPPVCHDRPAFAVTTESRGCSPAVAAGRVADAIHLLEHTDHGLTYKKVDSNMRGNVGAELDRLWQIQGRPIILCPALPRRGRTVIDGRVLIDSVPLTETEMAHDPQSPVRHACAADIVGQQAPHLNTSVLSLEDLRRDASPLPSLLDEHAVVISDAETDDDLAKLAGIALAMPEPPVFSGSAGLATALAERVLAGGPTSESVRPLAASVGDVGGDDLGAVLAVLASSSDAMDRQVRLVERRLGVKPIRFACENLSWDEDEVPELTEAIDEAVPRLLSRHLAIVQAVGALPSVSRPVELIVEHLAHLAFVAVKQGSPSALLVGGGSTAHAVLSTLGTAAIEVEDDLLPGIAVGTAVGGHFSGRPVGLKSGAAGEEDALMHVLRHLSARAELRELAAGEDK